MKKLLLAGSLGLVISFMVLYPRWMLSPGDLVKGHQDLNDKCLKCHQPFRGINNDKCILCHKLSEIGKDTTGDLLKKEGQKRKILFHQGLSDQSCSSCHTDHKGALPQGSQARFDHTFLSGEVINTCSTCHQKPGDKIHAQISSTCKGCHNTEGWKNAVKFDHAQLEGVDRNNCTSCHLQPKDKMHQQFSPICSSCHSVQSWKSTGTFNHDMITGADKTNCSGCHQKPNDSFHGAMLENCDKCHTISKWKPATFEHSSFFVLDGNHNTTCGTCHTNTRDYKMYSCYGCHEHSESKIRSEHNEEGISNFSNCISCHRSGNEHDMRGGSREGKELDQKEVNSVKTYMKSIKKHDEKEGDDD
ncbi:MAG: cytochrome c3 family protein [bacterium]|nr:cytochrome c3 family protein [bacterium]